MAHTIQIDCVRIAGFRGIRNMEITLPRVAVLIGPNNSGKTSIIKALQLALGNYSPSEEDFFIDTEEKRVNQITVDVKIIPVNDQKEFNDQWIQAFGRTIQQDNGRQFMAFRTEVKPDQTKGGVQHSKYTLNRWPEFNNWKDEKVTEKDKTTHRVAGIQFISPEPQRDIYNDLRDKKSFVGRVLSEIRYDEKDTENIEKQINKINQSAIEKSSILNDLKNSLKKLSRTFKGAGEVEISPFPQKIRDLAKYFSIHFGEQNTGVFSMEYHGMGTRSWASILTVQTFIDLQANKHKTESEPFFPLFAAEEPEAHLHPNAQKTLYNQIVKTPGQVVISTHSPYFASVADTGSIRSLKKTKQGVTAQRLLSNLGPEEVSKIKNHIIYHKGDMLFSRAWILCEGRTEENLIPTFFELMNHGTLFDLGISCMGVEGQNYTPFLHLARNMGIPAYIISDSDTKKDIQSQIQKFNEKTGKKFKRIFFLSDNNNLEKDLLFHTSLREYIIKALIKCETLNSTSDQHTNSKTKESKNWTNNDILNKMKIHKILYSEFLADIIRENHPQEPQKIIPPSILECFHTIKEDIKW